MTRTQLLQRLYALQKRPDLYKELSNEELAEFVRLVLSQVEEIDKSIKAGRLDGYTPQPGKDYLSKKESEQLIKTLFQGAVDNLGKEFSKEKGTIEQAVAKRLSELQNGKDGQNALITDEMLQDIAARTVSLIELPNFDTLITQEPAAIRDALELLQGEERLDKSAIKGLPEMEEELKADIRRTQAGGVSRNTVAQMIADAPGAASAWGSITGTLSNQTDLQTALDGKVGDTGNETVAGVKTFSSSPIVPTPTTDFQAATKKYVDDNIGGGGGVAESLVIAYSVSL